VDGVDDGSGVFQWATRSLAEFATNPACVDEPAAGVGLLHFFERASAHSGLDEER